MAALPMAMLVGFSLILGFSPVKLLRDKLQARLAAAALETGEMTDLYELLHEGNAPFNQQAVVTRVLRLARAVSLLAHAVSSAAAVETSLGKSQEALRLLPFEPQKLRPDADHEHALHQAIDQIAQLNRAIWLDHHTDLRGTADRLTHLARRLQEPYPSQSQQPIATNAPSSVSRAVDRLAVAIR
jgi:hypothetical protein